MLNIRTLKVKDGNVIAIASTKDNEVREVELKPDQMRDFDIYQNVSTPEHNHQLLEFCQRKINNL